MAGIETTATFDSATDEFIIHTPSNTATKWWPGDMGTMANFALVFARLIIKNKDYGVASFLVQLRDRDTHKHMPGVQSGDLGPKLGYKGKDNGWLTFNNVRIPRDQMMQKFMRVDRDGTFKLVGDLRILYSTMLNSRVTMISGSALC